ncbi:hypothetical protein CPB86DRAFT_303151 [Serendipita vermifera]|nr:hypothetical protein CPB86DRAFT_303151 [Serendipita vermifera]
MPPKARSVKRAKFGPTITYINSSGNKKRRIVSSSSFSRQIKIPTFTNKDFRLRNSVDSEVLLGVENLSFEEPPTQVKEALRKTKTQYDQLEEWVRYAGEYLECLLSLEAITKILPCMCASGELALYKCTTCIIPAYSCQACMVTRHQYDPFHRILKWNGHYFEAVALHALGITLPIRHPDGSPCPHERSQGMLTVVHINGFHEIEVRGCDCVGSPSFSTQLFLSQLFGASITSPKTAFTFECLDSFRLLHLEGKISTYTYMQTLTRMTTDEYVGVWTVKDRAREFRRVARQWNYLLARKQSIVNDSDLLVSKCPACPQPGVNIPLDWEQSVPFEKHWIYRQFIHFDANFRLVSEASTKNSSQEAGLWEGRGFFVDNQIYQNYLATNANNTQPPSSCSNLRAVSSTNRSRFQSLDVTGVAGAVCRHDCAIPHGFVNLFKGERYVNSDFAMSSLMKNIKNLKELVISYDIACQFSKHFFKRFRDSPFLSLPDADITFMINKLHALGHKEDCRYRYSFNYVKGVGRTDGEGIERFWSTHNHLSGSTSKMAPGFRLDTLNLHFMDWNFRKSRRMASELHNRLNKARSQLAIHSDRYEDLIGSIEPTLVTKWVAQEEAFDFQEASQNIYRLATDKVPSRQQALSTLVAIETQEGQRGFAHGQEHTCSAAVWINDGLEIENDQRRLKARRLTVHSGSMERDHVLLSRARSSLWGRIVEWKTRLPTELDAIGDFNDMEEPLSYPEDEQILLPSSLAREECPPDLGILELRLREGQANDSLKTIRLCLSQRLLLYRDKRLNARGQELNARANSTINRFNIQINQAAEQYRQAHRAMCTLGMKANDTYQDLKEADITTSNVFNTNRSVGRGKDTGPSWIWRSNSAQMGDALDANLLEEVMRVQFLDVKVNHDRWKEEVELLEAEIARSISYFKHFATEWSNLANRSASRGCVAYCYRMAAMYGQLAQKAETTSSP